VITLYFRNSSKTFSFECNKNIQKIAVSPDETLMITVDRDGKALLVNLAKLAVLHHFNFKSRVRDIKYSPCGRFVATTHEKAVQVWLAPGNTKEFSPFALHAKLSGHYDDTTCLDWSCDSRFVVIGSKDMTAKIFSVAKIPEFQSVTLSGHRSSIVACFFQKQSLSVYTVARDCAVYVWHCHLTLHQLNQETEQTLQNTRLPGKDDFDEPPTILAEHHNFIWDLANRHLFLQKNTSISCAQLHHSRDLLVLGFANGVFSLHEMPDFDLIHSLSISNQTVTSVCINKSGEWLALGCRSLGQLVVWEWQSESFILKQQGHYYDINVLTFSPDGQWIATGGDDGKVKLWDTVSGFCFVTFHKHTAAVTGVTFGNSGQFVLSSSLDGTVRAFDLNRYRNFRTFTSAYPVQFSCVGVNKSSDMVCAGSQDTFEVFVWSVQSGRLLEVSVCFLVCL
jgi:periodic tryptophan protein 2